MKGILILFLGQKEIKELGGRQSTAARGTLQLDIEPLHQALRVEYVVARGNHVIWIIHFYLFYSLDVSISEKKEEKREERRKEKRKKKKRKCKKYLSHANDTASLVLGHRMFKWATVVVLYWQKLTRSEKGGKGERREERKREHTRLGIKN